MKKTAYSAIAMIIIAALGACSSNEKPILKTTPMQPTVSSTIYRPAPVPPAWCVAMREFKTSSDEDKASGDTDQLLLSVAALQPYDESPGVMRVVADVFAIAEANAGISTPLQSDYTKLQSDETKSLAVCP